MLRAIVIALLGCAAGCASAGTSPPEAERTDEVPVAEPPAAKPKPAPHDDDVPAPKPVDVSQLPPGPVGCDTCGPAPGYPTSSCPDGEHHGGRGPCVKFEDGHCGWIRLVCEASSADSGCAPHECGAAPSPVRWRCPDEIHYGEFECVRSEDGRCGWTWDPCLGSHAVAPPSPPPPPSPGPAREPCDPLPSPRVLQTWEVQSICPPSGGPVQPKREVVLELGDGTRIIEDARGCFRARYRQCHSK